MKYEWRLLRADGTAWVVAVVLGAMVGGAVINVAVTLGGQVAAHDQAARTEAARFDRMQAEALAIEAEAARKGEAPPTFQAEAKYWGKWGPRDSVFVGAWNAPRVSPPPSPLTVLAVGQSDLVPSSYKLGLDGRLEWQARGRVAQQLEHPLLLKASRFDLAFVMLYLYPLIILAISANMITGEKETGTLNLLLSQPVRLGVLVFGKVGIRALLVLTFTVGISFGAFTIVGIAGEGGAVARVCAWSIAVVAYGAFWFGLCVVVNAFARSQAASALMLAVAWLAFLVIIPSAINAVATALYPVPPRSEFLNASRAAEDSARTKRKALVAAFLQQRPDIAAYGWTVETLGIGYPLVPEAMPEAIEANEALSMLQPVIARFEGQLAAQQRFVSSVGFLSPAVLMQSILYDLAGTGRARHEHFLRQLNAFNETWNAFFDIKPFRREMVNAADYDRLPRFHFREELVTDVLRRTLVPFSALSGSALAMWIVALYMLKRCSVVG
jgi:ABC-2 type transport system permease protein